MADWWKIWKSDSFVDGADFIASKKTDLKDAVVDGFSGAGDSKILSRAGNIAGGTAEVASTVVKPAWWLTKRFAIVGALAGAGIWAYSKNEEKKRDAQNTLRQANLDEMNAQTAALSARTDQAMLGANTLCGLEPVEGENVARLGRSSGGKNNVLDFVQPTPDVARGALPA